MNQCQLCNEPIDAEAIYHGAEVIEADGNFWHPECYAEYFGLDLEDALEEAGV